MMKIVVLTSSYPRFPGDGTAPFVKSLADCMVRLGHEVIVVAPYDPKVRAMDHGGVTVDRFRYIFPERYHIMGHAQAMEADVRIRTLSYFLLPFFVISAFIQLLRITIRSRPDVIHVHWVLPNGPVAMIVSMISGIPFILSLHGSDVYVATKYKLFGWVAGMVFKRARYITACSDDLMRNAISLGAPREKIQLVPWGADPEIFSPSKYSISFRSKLGINDREFIVSALGRMVYKKGFDKLIEAWKNVSENVNNARLLIGGDGPIRSELEKKVSKLNIADSVKLSGSVNWNKVPEFLSSSDLFVLPSIRDQYGNIDGLPTVLLEAMACGTPVIASNLGGIPLVIDDRQNGRLVPPGDVDALSQAILELLTNDDQRAALGNQARLDIISRYNWMNIAKLFIGLFEKSKIQKKGTTRMGSIYRHEMMQLLGLRAAGSKVLDVGCHNGMFLNDLDAEIKIGIDPKPIRRFPETNLVRADGCFIPFDDETFDRIFGLDVIEHVEDDREFAKSLMRVLSVGGQIVITTPSKDIKVFPSFTMNWVNKKWGHGLRSGYIDEYLAQLFKSDGFSINVREWNAPAYRILYFPVRALFGIFPEATKAVIRRLAQWDFHHQRGSQGFLIMEARRKSG